MGDCLSQHRVVFFLLTENHFIEFQFYFKIILKLECINLLLKTEVNG